jgi:hypothetical protein
MIFPCDEKENFLLQHRKQSQDAHVFTYGHIITTYASILAITLLIWPKSHETLNMIAHFVKVFCDIYNFPSLIFFLATITHNMKPREGFTLFELFFKFLYLFEIIFKTAGMKIHSSELSLARLAVDLW